VNSFALAEDILDKSNYDSAVEHLSQTNVLLPTFAELAEPGKSKFRNLPFGSDVHADEPHSANLLRVHWYNNKERNGLTDVPGHLVLGPEFTGVAAPIIVILGDRFPMIRAHKVLAAYACLVTRLVSGQFDPVRNRAIWPSTGNYCRGGVAISRILGCRGVAVLPAGMSQERFDWLENWVTNPDDIIRTPGSESNVKEIYDKCAELSADPTNVILNQFSEFANYLVHYSCTGQALENIYEHLKANDSELSLAAFVAGTGSGGTLGAGDYLKEKFGTKIVAVEPIECPTMLYNGYGEHNIQGIGDKHIPLVQNVMNTDIVAGVSDESCDSLNVLFNTDAGREYLTERRKLDPDLVASLNKLGLSGIANLLASIKTARMFDLTENDAIITVATDSAALYESERASTEQSRYPGGFDQVSAGEVYAQHLCGLDGDHIADLSHRDKKRIFNLGYYTWVEQQGISLEEFDARRDQRFWKDLTKLLPVWDQMIEEFNHRTGVGRAA
jgi:cysteine synthase